MMSHPNEGNYTYISEIQRNVRFNLLSEIYD
jgi:hypothetical protein